MIQELKKICFDTLTGPEGKYSRKSLTSFVCLIVAIVLGVLDMFKCCTVNVEIFYGFLGLGGGTLAMTVWDKVKGKAQ